ncbi:hypothetical protein [Rubritalea tangerina]|uniref:hypothetical protein n=1 Tax=Rubritalea tangerina TaxID=430798 RepID=UPI003617EED6
MLCQPRALRIHPRGKKLPYNKEEIKRVTRPAGGMVVTRGFSYTRPLSKAPETGPTNTAMQLIPHLLMKNSPASINNKNHPPVDRTPRCRLRYRPPKPHLLTTRHQRPHLPPRTQSRRRTRRLQWTNPLVEGNP